MFADRFLASLRRRSSAREGGPLFSATAVAVFAAALGPATVAEAKGPGKTYCFYSTCHRVKTIAETEALVGRDMTLTASHYDSCKRDRFNPCGLTSSGEEFDPDRADNAASPILPDGTIALVWSKATREAIVLRINNAGPYWGNRKLDLSRSAARKLGIAGVGEVTLRVLKAPTEAEARYSRNRKYEPVPGPIGQFANLDLAHGAMAVMVALGQPGTNALASLPGLPTAVDPAVDLASLLRSPLVPRLGIPRGALADALLAQSAAERRVVTANVLPMIPLTPVVQQASFDLMPVVPKLTEAPAVIPRRTLVRSVEVPDATAKPPVATPAAAVKAPPVAAELRRGAVRAAKAERKPSVAARVPPVKARRVAPAKMAVAVEPREPTHNGEIHVGFTTYAELRYRTKTTAPTGKWKKPAKPSLSNANPPAVAAVPAPPSATKRAGLSKGGKSAALRKAGGWESSAIVAPLDALLPRPHLTGPHPSVPAGEMRDESETPRRPGRRVPPSALA